MKISNLDLRTKSDIRIKDIETGIKEKDKEKAMRLLELEKINELHRKEKAFSNILEIEEKYILSQIEFDNRIAENRPLRDHVFLLFVQINFGILFILLK